MKHDFDAATMHCRQCGVHVMVGYSSTCTGVLPSATAQHSTAWGLKPIAYASGCAVCQCGGSARPCYTYDAGTFPQPVNGFGPGRNTHTGLIALCTACATLQPTALVGPAQAYSAAPVNSTLRVILDTGINAKGCSCAECKAPADVYKTTQAGTLSGTGAVLRPPNTVPLCSTCVLPYLGAVVVSAAPALAAAQHNAPTPATGLSRYYTRLFGPGVPPALVNAEEDSRGTYGPPPAVPVCDCGAKKTYGAAVKSAAHSSWCTVAEGKR